MRIVDALAPCFAIACAAICLDAPLAFAADAPLAEVDLAWAVGHADSIALVRVADPPSTVTPMPMRGCVQECESLVRYRRNLVRVELLAGTLPARVAVDEPSWQERLSAQRQCSTGAACRRPAIPAYLGQLSREPPPGEVVLVFVHRVKGGGFELVADRSLDVAARQDEVRKLLRASAKGNR